MLGAPLPNRGGVGGEAFFYHCCNRARNNPIGIYAHLSDEIVGLELRLVEVLLREGISVNDDRSVGLGVAQLRLESCCVHGHQHVALVARRIDLSGTDVHLKTAHTRQRTLRGADVGGIVGER